MTTASEQALRTFLAEPDAARMTSALARDSAFVFPRPAFTTTVIRGLVSGKVMQSYADK